MLSKGSFFLCIFLFCFNVDAQKVWRPRACMPQVRRDIGAFSLSNGKGYVLCGEALVPSTSGTSEVWQYDPNTDQWTQKNNFPPPARAGVAVFVINDTAYAGLGF